MSVEFGPSRSKRFQKAVAEARCGRGDCRELEAGRYRVSFLLGEDAAAIDRVTTRAQAKRGFRDWIYSLDPRIGKKVLRYRKIDQFLLNYVMGEKSGLTAPVVDIASATATVCVGRNGPETSCR